MINIQTKDRRRLEVSKRKNGDIEMKIMLNLNTAPDRYIATLVISKDNFEKLGAFFEKST